MILTDRFTGRKYQLVKRTNSRGAYLNARTGHRYNLVKVYV